ncbi:MAG: anti-sigma factor [Pseudomonadota bacterium]
MTKDQYESQLDELIDKVMTAPADAFTALPDDDGALRVLLRELDAETPADLCQSLELAAAAPLVSVPTGGEAMPAHLRRRIELDASNQVGAAPRVPRTNSVTSIQSARRRSEPVAVPDTGTNWFSGAGWLAAAALLVALVFNQESPETNPAETTVADVTPDASDAGESSTPSDVLERNELLEVAGTITVPWLQPNQAGFELVTGDVVWNDALQQGYLRLANMPINDTAARQYQLWIVDPDRDAEPVDGGVFDIVARNGEVLVPIDAKLRVSEPTAFAITLEQRGGVVVSEGPLLVVAPVAS